MAPQVGGVGSRDELAAELALRSPLAVVQHRLLVVAPYRGGPLLLLDVGDDDLRLVVLDGGAWLGGLLLAVVILHGTGQTTVSMGPVGTGTLDYQQSASRAAAHGTGQPHRPADRKRGYVAEGAWYRYRPIECEL